MKVKDMTEKKPPKIIAPVMPFFRIDRFSTLEEDDLKKASLTFLETLEDGRDYTRGALYCLHTDQKIPSSFDQIYDYLLDEHLLKKERKSGIVSKR